MFEKILVCLDGSKLAEQILPCAAEQALRFGSEMTLLQVMSVPTSIYPATAGGSPQTGKLIEDEIQRHAVEVNTYLEGVALPLREKGINVKSVILEPSVTGEAIVKYALDSSMDLVCIATHGHSGLGRVVFGSVADYVLRESGLPILVIKPKINEK